MSKDFTGLTPGLKGHAEMIVTEADTALALGSGRTTVLATPAMVALMEAAAQAAIDPHLPAGYMSVGTLLNIRHDGATPIGMKVIASAELTGIEGRNLFFRLHVRDEKDDIGQGEHERTIASAATFTRLLRQKTK